MTENPSDLLRRAAGEMRAKAEAATAGPWEASKAYGLNVVAPTGQIVGRGLRRHHVTDAAGESFNVANAEHIAAWHPLVALAMVDLLETAAEAFDDIESWSGPGVVEPTPTEAGALTVARAFLGEP